MEAISKDFPDFFRIPAVTFEELAWERGEYEYASRRATINSIGPYLAAIPPMISPLEIKLDPEAISQAEDLAIAIARFDSLQAGKWIPLSAVTLRSESAASSEVENLSSSAKALGLAQLGISKSPNANLISDNVKAMEAAIALPNGITSSSIIEMQRILLERSAPEKTGRFRNRPVWIGGRSPHVAKFVPPASPRVPELIDDLLLFAKRMDLPRLVQIAIAHAQFETIHPFEDGNGRTGRAIIHAMIKDFGLATSATIPISAGLLSNTKGYFDALEAYRHGDLRPILETFFESTQLALNNASELIRELKNVQFVFESVQKTRKDSAAARLLQYLPQYPVLDSRKVREILAISEPAALNAIASLEDSGILVQTSSARRNRTWQAPLILECLEEFAEKSRRRN